MRGTCSKPRARERRRKVKPTFGWISVFKRGRVIARCKVDLELLDELRKHRWQLSTKGYACRTVRRLEDKTRFTTLYLHRVVAGPGESIEHDNGDKMDCRRSNLKVLTTAQNTRAMWARRRGQQYLEPEATGADVGTVAEQGPAEGFDPNQETLECSRCGCDKTPTEVRTNVSGDTVCDDCWGSGDDDIESDE